MIIFKILGSHSGTCCSWYLLNSACLSRFITGHSVSKCSGVSLSSSHNQQNASSLSRSSLPLLISTSWRFMNVWPVRKRIILAKHVGVRLEYALISFHTFGFSVGKNNLVCLQSLPSLSAHNRAHSRFRASLINVFSSVLELLISICVNLLDWLPAFAASSAISLPGMPTWAFTHCSVTVCLPASSWRSLTV
jgi:hypothetical protein